MPPAPLRLIPSIHRATHRVGLYLADLGDNALSQGEAHILAELAAGAPATISSLHRGLAHKPSTLTSILDRLVDRGLITRKTGTADRRTFVIDLTARGRTAARRVHQHLQTLERNVAERCTARELQTFVRVLAAVEDEARAAMRRPVV
jgi:MarR family transcriptional regulator, organic hydroperoxide resistance regulator